MYRGENCVDKFLDYIIKSSKNIYENFLIRNKPFLKTNEIREKFESEQNCHICGNVLEDDRVMDHDHITGKYVGAAHNKCNLNYKLPTFIPVVFHNLSNFDSHLFIEKLTIISDDIHVIAKSKEKFISFSAYFNIGNENRMEIRFLDSFQFLSSSLRALAQALPRNE
jgi:hypothetical protein